MMDTANLYGEFLTVFDGSDDYPDTRIFLTTNVTSGHNYIFRVKAKYQNGFTAYSALSLPVYACIAPQWLLSPTLISVTST